MRKIPCPLPQYKDAWIALPDVWLGIHAQRRDEAIQALPDNTGRTLTEFAVALALLDDWNIPGLAGNPENWDFKSIDLQIIAWVNAVVPPDFLKCFIVPKALPDLSGSQEMADRETNEAA